MLTTVLPIFWLGLSSTYRHSTVLCLWHNYTCVDECPEGMIEVKSNCSMSYWKAPKTCDNHQTLYVGTICGFSRCDCPEPTVLDVDTGYCYEIDNCPTKHTL